MVTIKLYGHLQRFGSELRLDVRDTAEAVRAICSQIPEFRTALQQGLYKVRIGRKYLDSRFLEKGMFYRLKKNSAVHFMPVLKGAKRAGVFNIIIGVVLIAASWYAGGAAGWAYLGAEGYGMATAAFMMGASMILSGVSQMLTKTPEMSMDTKESEKKRSTSFSNLGNLSAQGRPVPLAYGRILTGSLLISQGIETLDIQEAINKVGAERARTGLFSARKRG